MKAMVLRKVRETVLLILLRLLRLLRLFGFPLFDFSNCHSSLRIILI